VTFVQLSVIISTRHTYSTIPTGRTYTTKLGGSLFFPILATPTGEAAIRKLTTEPGQGRGLMMPRRKKTRQQERHDRVTAERRIKRGAHRRRTTATPRLARRHLRTTTVLNRRRCPAY
jgi:hypothetical protein